MQAFNAFLGLISKTEGREKVLRLFQYICLHAIQQKQRGAKYRVYKQMRITRKLLRFFLTLDFLYQIRAEIPLAIQSRSAKVELLKHLMSIMQKVFLFLFFSTDHWVCLSELSVLPSLNYHLQLPISMKFWFLQNVFGILHDVSCMAASQLESKDLQGVKKLIRAIKHYSFDLFRCFLDLIVALFYLKKICSAKTAGIVGVISSIMGIMQSLQKL